MTSHRTARRLTAAALALAAIALPLAAAPSPAGAGQVVTTFTATLPVTWVDGDGRQVLVASVAAGSMTVVRDDPAGDPDPDWGEARTVDLPSLPGASSGSMVAADDDGVVTVVRTPSTCTQILCDRWFDRIDGATGARVGLSEQIPGIPALWRGLDDGSVLLAAGTGGVRWYGADGTERQVLPQTTDDVLNADVDAAGRLLVLDTGGTVTRYPVSGAPDLDLETTCDLDGSDARIGASAVAPGFAVACIPDYDGAGGTVVTRYADDGSPTWATSSSAPGAPTGYLGAVTLTADGRVWVGSRGFSLFGLFPQVGTSQPVRVTPVTAAGWQPVAYERATQGNGYADFAGGVVQLRPIGEGNEVAIADIQVCCRYPNNTSAHMSAHSAVVPYRPGPPLAQPSVPGFRTSRDHTVTVLFGGSSEVPLRSNRNVDQYRVDAVVDGTATTVTTPSPGPGLATQVDLPQPVPGGTLLTAEVTAVNSYGDGAVSPLGATITPYSTVARFVDHLALALYDGSTVPDRAAYIESLTEGDLSPGAFMEELLGLGTRLDEVEPAARIYQAAFLREPDIGGLRYWVERRRTGARVASIAESFVRSSEFVRRYGTLGNRAFVERIYQNVLGRPGDQAGIAFWTRRLDTRRATRGAVLAGFSESGEFVRKTNPTVQPLTVTFLLLGRRPTAAEKAVWSTAEAVYADMPQAILDTPEYIDLANARWPN